MNRGFSTIMVSIVSLIIIFGLATGSYYLFGKNKEEVVSLKDFQSNFLEFVTENDLSRSSLDFSTIEISKNIGNFLRASIVNVRTGKTETIFAVKIGDQWKIVEFGKDVYSCERMVAIGFDDSLINDCTLSYPEVKKISEVHALYAKDRQPFQASIIGTVLIPKDPNCNCITVLSDGEEVVVYVDSDADVFSDLEKGDIIVVEGTVGANETTNATTTEADNGNSDEDDQEASTDENDEQNQSNDDAENGETEEEITIDADEIHQINEEGDEEFVQTDDGQNNDSDQGNSGGSSNHDDEIPEPDGISPNESSGTDVNTNSNVNLYDIDRENQIRLLND